MKQSILSYTVTDLRSAMSAAKHMNGRDEELAVPREVYFKIQRQFWRSFEEPRSLYFNIQDGFIHIYGVRITIRK